MDWNPGNCTWPDDGDTALVDQSTAAAPATERRLQVRAYNYWARMLGRRRFPSVADLCRGKLSDIGPRAVLLDLSDGSGSPGIAYLGADLVQESGAVASGLQRLSDAPPGSLLARLSAHWQQVLAARSPSGFEADGKTARGTTLLYRGIMLPFSSDEETIDYVLAVVSWKEVALGSSPEQGSVAPEPKRMQRGETMLADWADGPACDGPVDLTHSLAPGFTAAGESVAAPLLAEMEPIGPEYALVMIRRSDAGPVSIVGEVPHDPALLAEASRRLGI